jgi:hypothetical protein
MYSLNLATAKKSFCLLVSLTLLACSTTKQISSLELSDNGYAQGYVGTHYAHSKFTPVSKDSLKKSLNSDHQLMMSLLNRPMTADQVMMLSFAQERASYTDNFTNYANNAVMIKGNKASDNSTNRTEHVYAQLISQDINAVSISPQ